MPCSYASDRRTDVPERRIRELLELGRITIRAIPKREPKNLGSRAPLKAHSVPVGGYTDFSGEQKHWAPTRMASARQPESHRSCLAADRIRRDAHGSFHATHTGMPCAWRRHQASIR